MTSPDPFNDNTFVQMMAEDFGSDSTEEAAALRETIQQLQLWHSPEPDAPSTTRLFEALLPALPAPRSRRIRTRAAILHILDWPPLLLLRAQTRMIQSEIWIASALVMALGVLVTAVLFSQPRPAGLDVPLVLIAPVVAACGVAFLYSARDTSAVELENTLPTSPALVMLARLLLIFTFDCALGIVGSVALTLMPKLTPMLTLWPLVSAWLAPMAFLSALSFLCGVLFNEPVIGMMISMALWTFQISLRFLRLRDNVAVSALFRTLPDLLAVDMRPWLLIGSAVLIGFALWWVAREETLVRSLSK